MSNNKQPKDTTLVFRDGNPANSLELAWNQDTPMYIHFQKMGSWYFESAMALFEFCKGANGTNIDSVGQVALYLSRQAVELYVKAWIIELVGVEDSRKLIEQYRHDIYKALESSTFEEDERLTASQLTWLKHYLKSISVIDPQSNVFRYPLKSEFVEAQTSQHIDLYLASNNVQFACNLLSPETLIESNRSNEETPRNTDFLPSGNNWQTDFYLWTPSLYLQDLPEELISQSTDRFDDFQHEVEIFGKAAIVLKNSTLTPDVYGFPLLYINRQRIELTLKAALIAVTPNLEERISLKEHNLSALYEKMIAKWTSVYNLPDSKIIREIITAVNDVDPKSFFFRYPCTDKLAYPNRPVSPVIDLGYAISQMEFAINDLTFGTFEYIDQINQQL